jgi:hypothetical protein
VVKNSDSDFTNHLSKLREVSFQIHTHTEVSSMPQNDFAKLLIAAVEESLASLGDSSKQAIFYHLEASFKLKKENIPVNLTEFAMALERIFGPGAPYLEKLIAQRLHEKLGLCCEDELCHDFLRCIDNAKKRLSLEEECITI